MELQNQKIFRPEETSCNLVQHPSQTRSNQARLCSAVSSQSLNTSRVDSPLLHIEKTNPIYNLNFSCCNVCFLPLTLSLSISKKCLASCSLYLPIRQLQTAIRFPLTFSRLNQLRSFIFPLPIRCTSPMTVMMSSAGLTPGCPCPFLMGSPKQRMAIMVSVVLNREQGSVLSVSQLQSSLYGSQGNWSLLQGRIARSWSTQRPQASVMLLSSCLAACISIWVYFYRGVDFYICFY